MRNLSVVIITLNEAESIADCIDSVSEVADEILIVDSFSRDKTVTIALGKGVRVIQNKFEGHIEQKNFAKNMASFDFVLSIDADETLSKELKESILAVKQSGAEDGYLMNRLNFYCGKPIRSCGWYPDTKLRLWDRTKGEWEGLNPHDKFQLSPFTTVGKLRGDILHQTYPTHQALLGQVEKFATISARHLKGRSFWYLASKLLFSPAYKFIRNYFFKSGFTEGAIGFTICYHQSREVFLKYFRAIRLKHQ
jgi:glycosyltransferase involved in cell wall biosynthesis